ncbi:MAG: hypothetical protein LBE13_18325, partial [Bacteroidales bacterium]|nr:hypothetical protein [Bacteroidales bacterium]
MKKILPFISILAVTPVISMQIPHSKKILDSTTSASSYCIAIDFFEEGYKKFPLHLVRTPELGANIGKLSLLLHSPLAKDIMGKHLDKLSAASRIIIEFSCIENNFHPMLICQTMDYIFRYGDTRSLFVSEDIENMIDLIISRKQIKEEDRALYTPFLQKFCVSGGAKWNYCTESLAIADCLNDIARENLLKFTVPTGKTVDGMQVFKIDTEATIAALPEHYQTRIQAIRSGDMVDYLRTEFFDLAQLNDSRAELFWHGVAGMLVNPISRDHLIRVIAARFYMYGDSAPKICARPAKDKEVTSMDLSNRTIIIDFNTLGHVYIDYNPLCRSDKTQRVAREVGLPFHQTLSHELGHYFDYLVFANLDFLRQDTGMLGFLSNSTFRNIFFPNVEYIPDFKNIAYEALFHPFLDCFKKISTEA